MAPRTARLPAPAAAALLAALTAEEQAKQRELARLATPPATAFDVCRGFSRALEEQLSSQGRTILRAFGGAPGGFAADVRALPLHACFAPAHVRDVCARADGFQPYLVSPEAGLRALVREAVELFRPPARTCLARAHDALAAIVRAAIATAAAAAHAQQRPKCEVRASASSVVKGFAPPFSATLRRPR
jgi:dynamin GTPase